MNNIIEDIVKEFNEKFPPPMLLGQNQEQLRNFIISSLNKVIEERNKEILDIFTTEIENRYLITNASTYEGKRLNNTLKNIIKDMRQKRITKKYNRRVY